MATPRGRFGPIRSYDHPLFMYSVTDRLHTTGSTALTATTSQHVKTLIDNPAENTKTAVILQVHYYANAEVFVNVTISPTGGLPTTSRLINTIGAPAYTGALTYKSGVGSSSFTGGLTPDLSFGIGPGQETVVDIPFRLQPGLSFGWDATAAGNTKMYINPLWIEI